MFGFWDDLMIFSNTTQKIQYSHTGTTPNRIATFEFCTSGFNKPAEYYHFQIIFFENLPNIVKCVYFNIPDGGQSATIGVQSNFFSLMKE